MSAKTMAKGSSAEAIATEAKIKTAPYSKLIDTKEYKTPKNTRAQVSSLTRS